MYVERYARDDQADDAQYFVGMTYLQESRPAAAIGELQKVVDQYPQGDMVDDSLAEMMATFQPWASA